MKNEEEHGLRASRLRKQQKKKKVNLILNSLIVIVLLLIIIVSKNIFFGGSEEIASDAEIESTEISREEAPTNDQKSERVNTEEEKDQQEADHGTNEEENENIVETEGGTDANVIKTIVNPAWEPVGTVQTGEHVNTYEGIDWDEMVKAISYAINLDESEFTIYWLGNDGYNRSRGTVYSNANRDEIYRVYIEWVDGQGWKPTKVEMLSQLAK